MDDSSQVVADAEAQDAADGTDTEILQEEVEIPEELLDQWAVQDVVGIDSVPQKQDAGDVARIEPGELVDGVGDSADALLDVRFETAADEVGTVCGYRASCNLASQSVLLGLPFLRYHRYRQEFERRSHRWSLADHRLSAAEVTSDQKEGAALQVAAGCAFADSGFDVVAHCAPAVDQHQRHQRLWSCDQSWQPPVC